MSLYYSPSACGFFSSALGSVPGDAIAITDDEWQTLHDGQATGKLITIGVNGRPTLVDRPTATPSPPVRLTMGQTRKALLLQNCLVTVGAWVSELPGEEGDLVRIEWEYDTVVTRAHRLVGEIKAACHWSDADVDAFFYQASQL